MATIDEARVLKLKLIEKHKDEAWFGGAGIETHNEGYAVRINRNHSQIGAHFPNTIDDVPIVVVVIGDIRALSGR